jgi:hypothetical protein
MLYVCSTCTSTHTSSACSSAILTVHTVLCERSLHLAVAEAVAVLATLLPPPKDACCHACADTRGTVKVYECVYECVCVCVCVCSPYALLLPPKDACCHACADTRGTVCVCVCVQSPIVKKALLLPPRDACCHACTDTRATKANLQAASVHMCVFVCVCMCECVRTPVR